MVSFFFQNLEHLYQHATMRLHHHSDILKLQGQVDQIVYLAQRRNVEKNGENYAGTLLMVVGAFQ